MVSSIRKNIQASNLYLIVLLLSVLLLLGLGQDLFHNHKFDLKHHYDCPAYHLYLLFSSILIFFSIYFFSIFILISFGFIHSKLKHSCYYNIVHSRAPPFQILKNVKLYLLKTGILYFQNLKGNKLCIQGTKGGVRLYFSSSFYS